MKRWMIILIAGLFGTAANAANVALFADTGYVDYDPGNSSSEASNMQAVLRATGNSVHPFTGVTGADWTTALSGQQVLVIPEQEHGSIGGAMDSAAKTAVTNFVNAGGTLIVAEDYVTPKFLDTVFGFALDGTYSETSTLDSAAAAGTAFAGGPPALPINNATGGYTDASLPSGAKCIYGDGTYCMVFQYNYGAGKIVYLAYDWYSSTPVGTQDGGWNCVLLRAAAGSSCTGALFYTDTSTPIPTLDPQALLAMMLVLAALAAVALRRS